MESYVKKWIALLGVIQVAIIVFGILVGGLRVGTSDEFYPAPRLAYWIRDYGTFFLAIPLIWSALAGLCWEEDSPSQWNEAMWLGSGIVVTLLLIIAVIRYIIPLLGM